MIEFLANRKPWHKHDCDACRFLATVAIDRKRFDLYACDGPLGLNLVVRAGSVPHNYQSWSPLSVADPTSFLAAQTRHPEGQALYLATMLGLPEEPWAQAWGRAVHQAARRVAGHPVDGSTAVPRCDIGAWREIDNLLDWR